MEAVRGNVNGMESGKEFHAGENVMALSGKPRVEIYDSGMAERALPSATHQEIVGCLFTEIAVYLRAKEEHCRIMMSPFAVFLKDDGRNYLTPDISVVCDKERLNEDGCHGAPDWVIEVVSPASRALDYGKKLGVYIDAGVREYWIVDSEKKAIVTYYLEQPDIPVIYHFGDIVKSGIYNDLVIDTSRLKDIQYRKTAQLQERGNAAAEHAPGITTSVEGVKAYIESHFPELLTAKNKGQIMKTVMGELKGKVDSKIVNEAVAELCKLLPDANAVS